MKVNKCLNSDYKCCGRNFVGIYHASKSTNSDLFNQILLSQEEENKIKSKYGTEFIEYSNNLPYIALNADRSCKAYKDSKCQIYDCRPDVCRLYPCYFDPFGGIFVDKNCPNYNENDFDKEEMLKLVQNRVNLFLEIQRKSPNKK